MRNYFQIPAFALCIVVCLFVCACTPHELAPVPPPKDESSVVVTEKSHCENSGPMQLAPDKDGRFVLTHIAPRTDHFCALLLPIDGPEFDLVASGAKIFDYRRGHPNDHISHVVFFNNTKLEIAGMAEVVETIAGTPEELILSTLLGSGGGVESILGFFNGRDYGFAIQLKDYTDFTKTISLAEARTLDPKFQRPYGYLFLDRHPVIERELQRRRKAPVDEWPLL